MDHSASPPSPEPVSSHSGGHPHAPRHHRPGYHQDKPGATSRRSQLVTLRGHHRQISNEAHPCHAPARETRELSAYRCPRGWFTMLSHGRHLSGMPANRIGMSVFEEMAPSSRENSICNWEEISRWRLHLSKMAPDTGRFRGVSASEYSLGKARGVQLICRMRVPGIINTGLSFFTAAQLPKSGRG